MFRTTLLVAWVIVCATTASLFAQPSVSPALLDRAQEGSVRVMIRVSADPPDARGLGTAAGRAVAQQRMLAAQDRVQAMLDAPASVRRYTMLPWVAARVTQDELQRLAQHPDVLRIEPDLRMRPSLVESTSLIHAAPLWNFGYTGTGWSIAILDTGVDASHPFFGGRVIEQACFSTTDAGDGSVSLCPGGAPTSTAVGSALPCSSSIPGCDHGTHVAGIAAGRGATASGVARAANIIAIQVFSRIDSSSGCFPDLAPCLQSYTSDQVAALDYVLARAGAENANRIAAANLSLAFPGVVTGTCDDAMGMPPMKDAVDRLRAIDIPTVVSAGNDGSTDGLDMPACISSVVSVGATSDSSDVIAGFSNRSPLLSLMAPGSGIISSVPGGGFRQMNGTSMAAPHVAGTWALLKQMRPGATVSAILGVLQATGVPVPDVGGRTYPRIQLDQAAVTLYGGVPPPPGPPTSPHISLSGGIATLQWSAPASGGPVAEYIVAVGSQPQASDIAVFSAGTELTVSAPVEPGSYSVRVFARNPIGQSGPSEEVPFTVNAPPPPGAPVNPAVTVTGNFVTLRWDPPTTGGTVAEYIVAVGSQPQAADLIVFSAGTEHAVSAIVEPGTYWVRVYARSPNGQSLPTGDVSFTVAPPTPPEPPSDLTFQLEASTVTLSWHAPAGGDAPIGYVIEAGSAAGLTDIAVFDFASTQTRAIFANVLPGTYHVRVRSRGTGGVGTPTADIVITVP